MAENERMARLSFRARLALVAAVAVGLAVVVAAVLVYVVVRGDLRSQADKTLQTRAEEIAHTPLHEEQGPLGQPYLDLPPFFAGVHVEVVKADGAVIRPFGQRGSLPVTHAILNAARRGGGPFFSDAEVNGREFRVYTLAGPGYALEIARDISEVNRTLHRIGVFLILIAAGGIAVAAGLGLAVSRAALAPVRKLTETTERVTETGDLTERIEVIGQDELSRLADSFNTMLAALEESSRAQRQLVADASHELRTPLTSLRTNIEVLLREGQPLDHRQHRQLMEDVLEQLGEMTTLVSSLVQLAAGDVEHSRSEEVQLELLVGDAIERAQRNRPSIGIEAHLDPTLVHGAREALERAIGNLLDNAGKWSSPGGTIEVVLRQGELTIRDHGPGIDEEDLPYVFERFYRSRAARGQPGSGLGLAIVRQVVESHGGSIAVERAEGGGTVARLRLPVITVRRTKDGTRLQRLKFPSRDGPLE
jgi:two-component system sensor histidine kinase MprB